MMTRGAAAQVLNLSCCSLAGSLNVAGLASLRALILNDNALEAVTGKEPCYGAHIMGS